MKNIQCTKIKGSSGFSIKNVSSLNEYNFGPEKRTVIKKKQIEERSIFQPNFAMASNFEILLYKSQNGKTLNFIGWFRLIILGQDFFLLIELISLKSSSSKLQTHLLAIPIQFFLRSCSTLNKSSFLILTPHISRTKQPRETKKKQIEAERCNFYVQFFQRIKMIGRIFSISLFITFRHYCILDIRSQDTPIFNSTCVYHR